jgi:hypothetical protein
VRVQDGEFVYRGEACQDFGSGAGRMVFTTVKLMELEGFVLDEHFLAVFADDGVVAEEQRAKRTVLLEGFFFRYVSWHCSQALFSPTSESEHSLGMGYRRSE